MKTLLLSLLVLSSVSAFAKDCGEEMSTNGIYQCEAENFKEQDDRLNDLYKKLVAKEDKVGQKKLKKAQLAWIAYRDAECTYSSDEMRDGSFEKVLMMGCLVSETTKRADELKDYVEFR